MAIRRELLLIALLLIIIAILVELVEFYQVNIAEGDASKFVLEDLQNKYPTADIAIMAITPESNNGANYYQVEARVTQNADTPCPQRSHIFYNYPAQNFVPQPPEVITQNCVVCTQGICTIVFPEEAIIASHTFNGTEAVQNYINLNPNAIPSVTQNPDSWEVTWDSQTASSSYVVDIGRNGSVLSVKTVPN